MSPELEGKLQLWAAAAVLLLTIGAPSVMMLGSYASSRYSCHIHWKDSGFGYRYKMGVGCMLEINGRWIPAENYRVE